MSITASYCRLTPGEFQKCLDDPIAAAAANLFNLDEMDDDFEDNLGDEFDFDAAAKSGRYLDIGKFWHNLHFLLTGNTETDTTTAPPPLGNVVLGGTPTKWEATYGMVRLLTPEEVSEVAAALEDTTPEDLRRRSLRQFGAEHLYGYHGSPPGSRLGDEDVEAVLEVFEEVRDFFVIAAQEGDVMLLSSD